MLLSELQNNQSAVITGFMGSGRFFVRLCEMGFSKGERVVCVCRSVFGSPILFSVMGSNIAVRKSDAEKIEVSL